MNFLTQPEPELRSIENRTVKVREVVPKKPENPFSSLMEWISGALDSAVVRILSALPDYSPVLEEIKNSKNEDFMPQIRLIIDAMEEENLERMGRFSKALEEMRAERDALQREIGELRQEIQRIHVSVENIEFPSYERREDYDVQVTGRGEDGRITSVAIRTDDVTH